MKTKVEVYQMFLNHKYYISNEFELLVKKIYPECSKQILIEDENISINENIIVTIDEFYDEYLHFYLVN